MRTTGLLFGGICVGGIICVHLAFAGSEVMTNAITDGLGSIRAGDKQLTASQIIELRTTAILEAVNTLKAEQASAAPDIRRSIECIRILGGLRASEASPTLVQIIDWKDPNFDKPGGLVPVETLYPSVSALKEIGGPAIRTVVDAIAQTTNDTCIRLYVKVLVDVEGPYGARALLDEMVSIGSQNQNIEKAKQWVEKYCPSSSGSDDATKIQDRKK